MDLRTPEGATVFGWHLGEHSMADLQRSSNFTISENFKITDGPRKHSTLPAKVFYKREDNNTKTHAVSIPLNYLLSLVADHRV
jgi:hypothetical protein